MSVEEKVADALRQSIRQPDLGFRENMVQALEGAGVLTLCDALDGIDTITRVSGIGTSTKRIVESWARKAARELDVTLSELKVMAERMKKDDNDRTSEMTQPEQVSAVPAHLRDELLRFELPKLVVDRGATTRVRNALRRSISRRGLKDQMTTSIEWNITLGKVEEILRSPSSEDRGLPPLGSDWHLAKACLEDTLLQHGCVLSWDGAMGEGAKAEPTDLVASKPANEPIPTAPSIVSPKPVGPQSSKRTRTRGVIGDVERHLREVGNPRTLDEMTDFILQSVMVRLQEGKDVFVETAGRWGLKDWSRLNNPSAGGTDDAASRILPGSIAAQIKEMHELRCQGIVTDTDFESYKKRVLGS